MMLRVTASLPTLATAALASSCYKPKQSQKGRGTSADTLGETHAHVSEMPQEYLWAKESVVPSLAKIVFCLTYAVTYAPEVIAMTSWR